MLVFLYFSGFGSAVMVHLSGMSVGRSLYVPTMRGKLPICPCWLGTHLEARPSVPYPSLTQCNTAVITMAVAAGYTLALVLAFLVAFLAVFACLVTSEEGD